LTRYALSLAILAFVVIVFGASITSIVVAARQSQSPASAEDYEVVHAILAIALVVLTLGLGMWICLVATPAWLRALVSAAFAALILDAVLGLQAPPLPGALGIFHALLAHSFLAVMVAMAVVTSASWNREAELSGDWNGPSVRPFALATPPVVFLQIALGAAYRHDVTGIMPHMGGAMVVALMALVISTLILQNAPGPKPLRRAAAILISIVLAQVCLGIAVFLMLAMNAAGTLAFVLATTGHVSIGSATLAASVVMALEVWRTIPPKPRP
jgi:heme A synthase